MQGKCRLRKANACSAFKSLPRIQDARIRVVVSMEQAGKRPTSVASLSSIRVGYMSSLFLLADARHDMCCVMWDKGSALCVHSANVRVA